MVEHEVIEAIRKADKAIDQRDIEALMDFYEEDATLVVEPGRYAHGKAQIAEAFRAIFAYFNNTLLVRQSNFQVIEGGVALVICKLELLAERFTESKVSMYRRPTYIFKKSSDGKWRCLIDNSYGTDL
jgi:uncharacterized protein (TIGR02246 family)